MLHALEAYNDSYITYPIDTIVQRTDIKLRVSEMDIKVDMDTDKNRAAQAQYYKDLFELYLTYDMEAVQVWGVCDSTSWIAASYPLPFDANLNPKPAFFSIVEAVASAGEE